jgi:geranylgeranyl reductase family protein
MTITTDIAIIGAGPAGTAAALHLGQLGVRNVTLLDRLDFPRDKTCGSGISPKGVKTLKALGVWDTVGPQSYRIQGLRLVTPGDRELFLSGGSAVDAFICHRRVLDHALVERAQSLGTDFVPHFNARALIEENGRTVGVVAHDGREVRARHIVVADGAHSKFVVSKKPKRLIQAIMGWWDLAPFTPHHVEMVFDKALHPLYGWLFPESETRVNIGICYEDPAHEKNARQLFAAFLEKHYKQRLAHAQQVGDWKGHPISYSYEVGELHAPGRWIIGEAGRMTHPATAEGIYQGMKSGMLAAEALAEVVADRRSENTAAIRYANRCRRAFLPSFLAAKGFRALVGTRVLDLVAAAGNRPAVKTITGKLMAQM